MIMAFLTSSGCGLITTKRIATTAGKYVAEKTYEKFKEDREQNKRQEDREQRVERASHEETR
jgi:hypothetical protein